MIPSSLWNSAEDLQRFLDGSGIRFCFVGGVACQRWGEPRVTRDLDVVVLVDFGNERPVIDAMLLRYQPRLANPVQFALQARVLLLKDIAGNGIDVALGGIAFEQRVIERASFWGAPGIGEIRTCSAEDLVVLKAFASRPQDWIDIEKVVIRQGVHLDRVLILRELTPLVELKEEPSILRHVSTIFDRNP